MVFENVEQIFLFIDKQRDRFTQTVSGISDEQAATQRRAPEAWSIAEIAEHLSISERGIVGLINRLLVKTEEKGLVSENKGIFDSPVSLVAEAERARDAKFEAPEMLIPNKGFPLSSSLESLNESHVALRELRERIETVNASEARFPHPAFGNLNLYQWIAFVGLHEAHHLRQIRETLELHKQAAAS